MDKRIRIGTLVIIFFLLLITIVTAEENGVKIGINQIIPTEDAEKYGGIIRYPNMKAYVSVRDKDNIPLPLLIKANFTLAVDGKPLIANFEVENFFYAKREKGVAFFILMNASGVMMGAPIEAQKKAVKLFIDQMRDQDTVSLYSYGEKINPVFEFQKKGQQLYELIDKIEVEVGSAPKFLDHLTHVARQAHNEENKLVRNVIITLSEGRDADSMFNEEKLFEFVDIKSIPIYSVGIPIPFRQLDRLDRISKHTGGAFLLANSFGDIAEQLKLIQKQVLECYVLEYKVNMKGDDDYHNLQINLNYKGEEALTTKIFYAKKASPTPWWLIILVIVIILVAAIIGGVFLVLIGRNVQRKKAGTAQKKKCKTCGRVQKDDWNECLFCKYLPPKKKAGK
ncbi:MAG: VWA domain-containing protein [Spirochaetales bacterium]|nr:VWA domain-containing protein [Spirochaetales bacterium]